jgi:hypothetical protein
MQGLGVVQLAQLDFFEVRGSVKIAARLVVATLSLVRA